MSLLLGSRCKGSIQRNDPHYTTNAVEIISPAWSKGGKSYYEHLRKEIEYHNLASKIDDLHKVAGNKTLNPNVEPDFEKLDKLLTEAMIYAESKCKRQFSTKY